MADQAADIEVTLIDQQNINNFSKVIILAKEKHNDYNQKKELFNQIDDALAEIDLHDDDKIKTKYGDCFFKLSVDYVRDNMETNQQNLKKQLKQSEADVSDCAKKMGKLKASLYTKFGNNINLEED